MVNPEIRARKVALCGGPRTIDEASRSVEAICATETPVMEFDYERYEYVPTVLLMSGFRAVGALPLLDNHNRKQGVGVTVKGSVRELRVVGDKLIGRLHFAENAAAEWSLVREGHLDAVSIGRVDTESTFVPAGRSELVGGRVFEGPVRLVAVWEAKELSLVPIGADAAAKVRSLKGRKMETENQVETPAMSVQAETSNQSATYVAQRSALWQHLETRNRDLHWDAATVQRIYETSANITEADSAIINEMARQQGPVVGAGPRLGYGPDQQEKFAGAVGTAIQMRALQSLGAEEQSRALPERERAPGWQELRGASLLNLAKMSLEQSGINVRRLTDPQIAQLAVCPQQASQSAWAPRVRSGAYHTPGSFSNLLLDASHKTLTSGFELEQQLTWRQIARVGQSVQDFKQTHRVALGDMPSLSVWDGYSAPMQMSVADSKVSFAVESYSGAVSISWKTILNDDLDALSRIPIRLGLAAARTVNLALVRLILSNPTMPDGQALFLETPAGNRYKSNYTTGTGAPAVSTVGALAAKMRVQPGLNSPEGAQSEATLNVRPKYLMVPAALETAAMQLTNSIADPAASGNAGVYNPFQNLQVAVEAGLDGTSSVAWYLFADPSLWDTFEVVFLSGQETPQTRSWTDDRTLALEYVVLQSFAPVVLDFRGAAKHKGEA